MRLHIAALAQLMKLPESKFHSVICFMSGCMIKTALPGYVIDDELTGYITRFEEVEKANEVLVGWWRGSGSARRSRRM